jgi:hypothetical protein
VIVILERRDERRRRLEVGHHAADALFRVVDAAYEKRSIAISSNIHPSKAHRFQ